MIPKNCTLIKNSELEELKQKASDNNPDTIHVVISSLKYLQTQYIKSSINLSEGIFNQINRIKSKINYVVFNEQGKFYKRGKNEAYNTLSRMSVIKFIKWKRKYKKDEKNKRSNK